MNHKPMHKGEDVICQKCGQATSFAPDPGQCPESVERELLVGPDKLILKSLAMTAEELMNNIPVLNTLEGNDAIIEFKVGLKEAVYTLKRREWRLR